MRLEFGGAGVHPLEHRPDAMAQARLAHVLLSNPGQLHQPAVRHAELLATEQPGWIIQQGCAGQAGCFVLVHKLLDLGQEPRVDGSQRLRLVHGHAQTQGLGQLPQPIRSGLRDQAAQILERRHAIEVEAPAPDFQRAQRLAQRFLERPANRHDLAD